MGVTSKMGVPRQHERYHYEAQGNCFKLPTDWLLPPLRRCSETDQNMALLRDTKHTKQILKHCSPVMWGGNVCVCVYCVSGVPNQGWNVATNNFKTISEHLSKAVFSNLNKFPQSDITREVPYCMGTSRMYGILQMVG